MKFLFKLLGLLLAAAFLIIGTFARLAWKLLKLLLAYIAISHIIRKAMA